MTSTHSEEASAVVWSWQEEKTVRRFYFGLTSPVVQAPIMGVIAGLFAWRHHVVLWKQEALRRATLTFKFRKSP